MGPQSRRILVIDDDTAIRELIEAALSPEGFEVTGAPNGKAGLEAARAVRPEVILLDMRMPVMDGWAFAEQYRREPGPHAPIVVFTAAVDAGMRAEEIRGDAYLEKPFEIDELVATIRRVVPR